MEAILRSNLGPALDLNRDRIYELFRKDLKWVLPATDSSVSSLTGAGDDSSSKNTGIGSQQPPRKKNLNWSRPCQIDRKDDGDESDIEEKGGNEQGTHQPEPSASPKGRKFACPFFKNDPVKYGTERTCVGPGWDKIPRLKYVSILSNLLVRLPLAITSAN